MDTPNFYVCASLYVSLLKPFPMLPTAQIKLKPFKSEETILSPGRGHTHCLRMCFSMCISLKIAHNAYDGTNQTRISQTKKKLFFHWGGHTQCFHVCFSALLPVLVLKCLTNNTEGAHSVRLTEVISADRCAEIRTAPSMA